MAPSTTFGASIMPSTTRPNGSLDLTLPPTLDSPALTPAVSHEDLTEDPSAQRRVPVHSPFYQHPPASFEKTHSRANSQAHAAVNEKDLEAGLTAPLAAGSPFGSKVSIDCSKECKMWPSKQTLVASHKAELKKKRENQRCGQCVGPVTDWWGRQTKRQRLIMKIALILFVIGVVVAIAVGITIAVNGTVYVTDNKSEQISDGDN